MLVIENLGCREAWENIDASGFCFVTQPLAKFAEANDVVALVVHRRWHQQSRHPDRFPATRQVMDDVAFDGGFDGGALLFPVGIKFIQRPRFENIAAQYMGTNLGTLFNDDH